MVKVIAHPQTNEVITQSTNNPEWGTFRVDEEKQVFRNGIFDIQKRTAFVRGRIELLQKLNLSDGKVMPGTIIRIESAFPQYEGQEPKINPTTGDVILQNGAPVYMTTEYTSDAKAQDKWLEAPVEEETPEPHNNNQGAA